MDTGTIVTYWLLYVVAGSIGFAYFIYGKKQKKAMFIIAGLGLCAYPYFVSNPYLMVGLAIGLVALPFLVKI